MHPGKEAGALHPEGGDEDVGDKDEEDEDGYGVVQAVQALLVGFYGDVSPSCRKHAHVQKHTHTPTKTTKQNKKHVAEEIYSIWLN